MAKTFRIQHMGGHITGPVDARGNTMYSEEEVERINSEFNRRRMSGNEMEQMIGFVSAGNLLRQCAKDLEAHAEHTGDLALLRKVCTSVKTIAVRLANQIEARQLGSILAQTHGCRITVAATPHPAMVNINLEDLLTLCNKSMEQCGWSCTCTRDQSKDCPLRKVFEKVPGVKDQGKEIARKDASQCPYKGLELEVEGCS